MNNITSNETLYCKVINSNDLFKIKEGDVYECRYDGTNDIFYIYTGVGTPINCTSDWFPNYFTIISREQ